MNNSIMNDPVVVIQLLTFGRGRGVGVGVFRMYCMICLTGTEFRQTGALFEKGRGDIRAH